LAIPAIRIAACRNAAYLGAIAPLVPLHAVKPLIAGSAAWNSLAPALFGFG